MRWTPCNIHTYKNRYGFCSFFCAYHVSRSRVLYFLFVYPLSLSLVFYFSFLRFVLTFLKWNPWHSNTLAGVDLPNYLLSWHEIFRTLCVNCDFFSYTPSLISLLRKKLNQFSEAAKFKKLKKKILMLKLPAGFTCYRIMWIHLLNWQAI